MVRELPTYLKAIHLKARVLSLLFLILSQQAKAFEMCQSDVKKCHECLMNMFLVSHSPTLHKNGTERINIQ